MKKRKVRKKVIKKKRRGLVFGKIVIVFTFILILFSLFIFQSKFSNKSDFKPFSKDRMSPTIASKSAIIITPYPTLSPKPTQTVLSGFCLHVPVLMYHHIQPEADAQKQGQTSLTVDNGMFALQMAYLAQNGYTPIWASDLANALITHTQLQGKPVVITMDDGYEDNYIYALPVLRQYGFKANLMIATGLMNNPDMLSWDEVKQMKDSGLYYFTNHTWSHYSINRGSQATINAEIDTAANQILSYTGQSTNLFTYPYGAYNSNAIQTLQQKGYIAAFTEIPGQYQCDSFIMTLHRTRVGNASLSSYGL